MIRLEETFPISYGVFVGLASHRSGIYFEILADFFAKIS